MTDREKAIVMAYTGTAMLTGEKFSIFHKYIEDILGRPVWTHELADDSVCEEIKEKSKSDFLELCKNEERPQGDLISRSALKEKLTLIKLYGEVFCKAITEKDIDNAPTVEPKFKDDIIEAFNQITDQEFEHSDSFWIETPKGKKIEFVKKRPQGKWRNYEGMTTCEKCGAECLYDEEGFYSLSRFCPNCGADMRKPNCVTCDHFGKCDGCEKGEEE